MSCVAWAAVAGLPGLMPAGCGGTPQTTTGAVSISQPPANGTPYTIQAGDTLYSIAQNQGVTWRDLMEANPNVDWQTLRSGEVICVPAGRMSAPPPALTVAPPPAAEMNPGRPGPIAAEDHFIWPLRGEIVAGFRQPVRWQMREPNSGVDIAAKPGAAVVAAKSGRVNTFTRADDEGEMVILEHQDQTATCYGHLAQILVQHGTWVKQGEVIGTAGSSGRADGTELSFRILQNDHFVDPLPLLSR